ncbi:hypothetical protein RJ639_040359 [Escallonia herrerae]|uniref:Uncharacterized protein n=1 Tax=Escallonia herrerae TaxID=1293975 RepID=A0AA89B5K9_9ASTE|nr:hypothetical protein RJ639_040359 [Escallonia herrerae]
MAVFLGIDRVDGRTNDETLRQLRYMCEWDAFWRSMVVYINGRPFVLREVESPFSNLEYTEVFRVIGDRCGGFVSVDEKTSGREDLQWARILVHYRGAIPAREGIDFHLLTEKSGSMQVPPWLQGFNVDRTGRWKHNISSGTRGVQSDGRDKHKNAWGGQALLNPDITGTSSSGFGIRIVVLLSDIEGGYKNEGERGLVQDESRRRTELKIEVGRLSVAEEACWRQKSRVLCFKEGDKNTRFLQRLASAHKRRNQIGKIRISGMLLSDEADSKREIVDLNEQLRNGDSGAYVGIKDATIVLKGKLSWQDTLKDIPENGGTLERVLVPHDDLMGHAFKAASAIRRRMLVILASGTNVLINSIILLVA